MDFKIEKEEIDLPPEDLEAEEVSSKNVLPPKSRAKYELVYKDFMDWRELKKVDSFSENVLLAYFSELSTKYKSSSLWARYSMLRSTLTMNHSITIEKYSRLRAFLKHKSDGYHAKKAKPFTPDEINKFINEAPDKTHLATKVALIMGITGACRPGELHSMDIQDVQDLGSTLVVTVPSRKMKVAREFTITGRYYQLCKTYADLRPATKCGTSFFLNYQNGKCTAQKVGINKFSSMGKQIATFLKLPHPEMYSGHSFRRSCSNAPVDAGGNITEIKRIGGWNSATVAQGFIDNLVKNEPNAANVIFQTVYQNDQQPDVKVENTTPPLPVPAYTNGVISMGATPGISLHNCSNVTVNVTYLTLNAHK